MSFDHSCEPLDLKKVWPFSNLPIVFWHEEVLKVIEKKLGKFCSFESDWETKLDRIWEWLQVEVDFWEGLLDEIELVWNNFSWNQRIHYWKVPFHCYGCHEVDHL